MNSSPHPPSKMFYSPYSSFFTSGLLSESQYPEASSSRSSSPVPSPLITGFRRGSLPTDSPVRSPLGSDEPSAFYFTMQPKRDSSEFRSFLSLDLAESNSLRSASFKRRQSSAKRTTLASVFPTIPETTTELQRPALPPTSSRPRHSRSRDSLRTIPSPKPAPSASLPDLPTSQPPSPILTVASPATTRKQSIPAPRLPSLAITPGLGIDLSSPKSPVVTSPRRTAGLNNKRISFSSSVCTRVRRYNRSHALARLEGRTASTRRKRSTLSGFTAERNFMSMSDDEEESSLVSPISGRKLPSIISLPPARSDSFLVELDVAHESEAEEEQEEFVEIEKPKTLAARRVEERGWEADEESESDSEDEDEDEVDPRITLSQILEPEDFTFSPITMALLEPSLAAEQALSAPAVMETFPDLPSAPSFLNVRKGGKDWFPLTSFIDLQNEEEKRGWSWRSFIEVAKVS